MNVPSPRIVVLGSINMDLVIRCAAIPLPGQTIMAESAAEFCGGKGANQAVAAALAGAAVEMIGAVGDDAFAARLLENLTQRGVELQHVKRMKDCASGLAVIAVETHGQNSIMVVPGANATLRPADVEQAGTVIESADLLLVQLEVPVDTVLAALQIARRSGVRVILDPAPVPQVWTPELLHVDLLCPNESEAAALVGHPVRSIDDAAAAARTLQQMGAANVAITLGEQGTMLTHGDSTERIPAPKVIAVDTTAAGDAFAGALAVHWSQYDCLRDAVAFASAAGALAAARSGAQASMATRHEIETLWRTT